MKTDRIDALALLRALIAIDRGDRHVCAVVRVPTLEEEDARRSHRERQRLVRERTAHINRIKGLLFGQGIRGVEPKLRLSRIDFAVLTTSEGHPIPDRLRRELEREYVRLNLVEQQLRTVEKERDTADRQDPAVDRKRQMAVRSAGGLGKPAPRSWHARSSCDPSPTGGSSVLILGLRRAPMTAARRAAARASPRQATAGGAVS